MATVIDNRKHLEPEGPFSGLWVRTANALRCGGYSSREQVLADLHAGKLRPYSDVRDFGLKAYRELLKWANLDEAALRYHATGKALPALSQRMLEFLRPDFPLSSELPKEEGGYGLHIMAWNLATLPPASPAAKLIEDAIEKLPSGLRLPMERQLADLVRRKRQMFPNDPRVIGECRPVVSEGETRLRVTWTDAPV